MIARILALVGLPSWAGGVALAAAILAGLGLVYAKGYRAAEARCNAAALEAKVEALTRDLNAWKAADEVERHLEADREAETKRLEEKVADYEKDIAAHPNGACALTDDDLRRMP